MHLEAGGEGRGGGTGNLVVRECEGIAARLDAVNTSQAQKRKHKKKALRPQKGIKIVANGGERSFLLVVLFSGNVRTRCREGGVCVCASEDGELRGGGVTGVSEGEWGGTGKIATEENRVSEGVGGAEGSTLRS